MRAAEYRLFLSGGMPPWLDRLQARVERTIVERRLLGSGDRVLVGLSGGKDSLFLLLSLALCRRRPDMAIGLEAVTVDWAEAPLAGSARGALEEFCASVEVPYRLLESGFPRREGEAGPTCYGCARRRKELVFSLARDEGFGGVAFGHHLDDAAATSLMNLLGKGRVEGLPARRSFFGGRLRVVRPLIDVPELSISHAASRLGLPVAEIDCPNRNDNERDRLKTTMAMLQRDFPGCRERLAALGADDEKP